MASLQYEAPAEVKAAGKHTATVFMMHGLGDSAQGWLPVGLQLKSQLPHVKWIFPNAPTRPISVNMGMRMPGWYDIYELGPGNMDRKEDSAGVHESGRYMKELIEKEIAAGTPAERIVVGGFSQGGAIALYSLRYPLKLAGVVGLSTYLPLRNEGDILAAEAAGTPVFMGHGTQDELIPLSWGEASGELLKGKGAAVELKRYPMGHSASEAELQDLTRFLQRVLP